MLIFGDLLSLALFLPLCSSAPPLVDSNLTTIFTDDLLYIPSTADLIDFNKLSLYHHSSPWYQQL
jgi:hypothetical protein